MATDVASGESQRDIEDGARVAILKSRAEIEPRPPVLGCMARAGREPG